MRPVVSHTVKSVAPLADTTDSTAIIVTFLPTIGSSREAVSGRVEPMFLQTPIRGIRNFRRQRLASDQLVALFFTARTVTFCQRRTAPRVALTSATLGFLTTPAHSLEIPPDAHVTHGYTEFSFDYATDWVERPAISVEPVRLQLSLRRAASPDQCSFGTVGDGPLVKFCGEAIPPLLFIDSPPPVHQTRCHINKVSNFVC